MEAKAILRSTRVTPRKIKILADLIRNKPVNVALGILKNTPKGACEQMEKLLKSAIANAEANFDMDVSKLYVKQVFAGPGTTMKRMRPRAQGRAFRILKRTSHITLTVAEKE